MLKNYYFRLTTITIYGTKYKIGCVIRVKCRKNGEFSYAQVNGIIVYENHKLFEVTVLDIIEYDTHCQAYRIEQSESAVPSLCLYNQFYCHGVLHLKEKNGSHFLVEKDDRNDTSY